MTDLLNDIVFLFERLNGSSLLDLFLVTMVFFGILMLIQDTQAMALVRGVFLFYVLLSLFTSMINLPAFSWLIRTTLPGLVLAIPVIFAPEIRRAMEKLGRAGSTSLLPRSNVSPQHELQQTIKAIVSASSRLSTRQHGALIILQRSDSLSEYVQTGVNLNAVITPELLLQIFYPNTPLHDGAAIIANNRVLAAACVMPLSASGILRSADRQMGLRHRAGLGISEASDAIAVVVSEETGSISIAHSGRMIRRLDAERLENILLAFYRPPQPRNVIRELLARFKPRPSKDHRLEE